MNLESLNKKVYGLPVWSWAVISALFLYVLYKWYKNRSASGGSGSVSPLVRKESQAKIQVAPEVAG